MASLTAVTVLGVVAVPRIAAGRVGATICDPGAVIFTSGMPTADSIRATVLARIAASVGETLSGATGWHMAIPAPVSALF